MASLRIGMVGLGGIAQKAWLPVLSAASRWQLAAAFSPTQTKAQPICDAYRIPYVGSSAELATRCDAVFVHSSTASHYAVVSELLNAGVHVCVDKPLAETLAEAERLAEDLRLLYVALTRARHRVWLLYSKEQPSAFVGILSDLGVPMARKP